MTANTISCGGLGVVAHGAKKSFFFRKKDLTAGVVLWYSYFTSARSFFSCLKKGLAQREDLP